LRRPRRRDRCRDRDEARPMTTCSPNSPNMAPRRPFSASASRAGAVRAALAAGAAGVISGSAIVRLIEGEADPVPPIRRLRGGDEGCLLLPHVGPDLIGPGLLSRTRRSLPWSGPGRRG
jgi:hypothetical protein